MGSSCISLHRQKNLSLSPYGSLILQVYGEIREKKTRFEIPRILAKYRRLAMHVKEMQPSVSVLDATDRERTQRIVASFIINLFKSLSESAQDFDSQQPFTRSPPFAPPLIRCARQGQAAAAARRLREARPLRPPRNPPPGANGRMAAEGAPGCVPASGRVCSLRWSGRFKKNQHTT